jgi:hypothetical protein
MGLKMSAKSRNELLAVVRPQYLRAKLGGKTFLLDGFVTATGYNRKYAVNLLSRPIRRGPRKQRPRKYDREVLEVLIILWQTANQICSKRLIPFLPVLIRAMERCGHLEFSEPLKEKLLSISPATADRLLKKEKQKLGKSLGTTRPGPLLRKQISIRTFTDWNQVKPGFLEADLVAHCGGNIQGQFLHTLTMTDIATGWTELGALPSKNSAEVLNAVIQTKSILPFPMLGFDSDNGSEFINYEMVNWCEINKITFTRSREYRKNDQAHVEEKNGSVVRRMVGYERYQGTESWQILHSLYQIARLYINFFQPSLKLAAKERNGARVYKKYELALTPYQRVINSQFIPRHIKAQLTRKFESLDPLFLLKQIQKIQAQLAATAVKPNPSALRMLALMQQQPEFLLTSGINSQQNQLSTG